MELLAPLKGIPEEVARGTFVNGLKGEIRAELRLLEPKSLEQSMDLAVKIELAQLWNGPCQSRSTL